MHASKLVLMVVSALLISACTTVPPDITPDEQQRLSQPDAETRLQVENLMATAQTDFEQAETRALTSGRPLSEDELKIASAYNIENPEKVRIYATKKFPEPRDPKLAKLLRLAKAGGFTTGYGIHVRPKYAGEKWLIAHELVHVRQAEELGKEAFIRKYLTELIVLPGNLIPMERDAIARSEAYLETSAPQYRIGN